MKRAKKDHKSPKIGSTFEKNFKGIKYRLKIVSTPSGIGYEVCGQVFSSPSTAAKSIAKTAANGWVFWHLEPRAHRTAVR